MLLVLTTSNKKGGHKETFGGDRYVYHPDCSTRMYAYVQTHQIIHIKHVQCFLYINYTSIMLLQISF